MSTVDPDLSSGRSPEPPWIKWVAILILVWAMVIITAVVAAGIEALVG